MMAQIPKRLHYVWIGNDEKPEIFHKCLKSWQEKMPDYEIVEINEKNFDLEKHIEKNSFLRECYKRNLWAYIADYVRIHYLYEHGGIYLDTDMEIVKDFSPLFESENIELPIDDTIDAFVVAMGEKAGDAGVKLTNDLRLAGYKVQSDYFDKKMKAQMKLADRYNAKFSIIIGDSELENGQYVVKDMKTYDQENVEFDNIVKYLEEKLKGEK